MSGILLLLVSPSADALRFQVREDHRVLFTGRFARIGRESAFFENNDGTEPYSESVGIIDHRVAMRSLIERLHRNSHIMRLSDIDVVLYRVPHGGDAFPLTTVMNRERLHGLRAIAHLHRDLPACVTTMAAGLDQLPHAAHTAVFDTGLTVTLPAEAATYAIEPTTAKALHLRRFGSDGIIHAGAVEHALDLSKRSRTPAPRRIISVHIGDRTSVTALVDGAAVDTSTGLTAAEGLPGLSGTGSTDPRLPLYLAAVTGATPKETVRVLARRSGLAAMTGRSSWSTIERGARDRDDACLEALMLLSYRIAKEVAGMTAATGGIDLLIFSGEGASWVVIEEVCRRLSHLGVRLVKRTGHASAILSAPSSAVRVVHARVTPEEALVRVGLGAVRAHDARARTPPSARKRPIRRRGPAKRRR